MRGLVVLPVLGIGWWTLGFPPGWGWIVAPVYPSAPVSAGQLVVFGTVVLGMFGLLYWLRDNI
jgi:hypothetical protein